jgi:hypothetical protein
MIEHSGSSDHMSNGYHESQISQPAISSPLIAGNQDFLSKGNSKTAASPGESRRGEKRPLNNSALAAHYLQLVARI